jgi:hypothetical protein
MGMEVNFDLEEITFYFSGKAITFLKIIIVWRYKELKLALQ